MTDVASAPASAGWYEDPADPDRLRWWNGAEWTVSAMNESALAAASEPPAPSRRMATVTPITTAMAPPPAGAAAALVLPVTADPQSDVPPTAVPADVVGFDLPAPVGPSPDSPIRQLALAPNVDEPQAASRTETELAALLAQRKADLELGQQGEAAVASSAGPGRAATGMPMFFPGAAAAPRINPLLGIAGPAALPSLVPSTGRQGAGQVSEQVTGPAAPEPEASTQSPPSRRTLFRRGGKPSVSASADAVDTPTFSARHADQSIGAPTANLETPAAPAASAAPAGQALPTSAPTGPPLVAPTAGSTPRAAAPPIPQPAPAPAPGSVIQPLSPRPAHPAPSGSSPDPVVLSQGAWWSDLLPRTSNTAGAWLLALVPPGAAIAAAAVAWVAIAHPRWILLALGIAAVSVILVPVFLVANDHSRLRALGWERQPRSLSILLGSVSYLLARQLALGRQGARVLPLTIATIAGALLGVAGLVIGAVYGQDHLQDWIAAARALLLI